jgi:hypothetical protein
VQVVGDKVGQHLGVGLAGEHDAGALQELAQHGVVLDDAVVHHRQAPGTVDVRVGVDLARLAVGRPAGVGDAQAAGEQGLALAAYLAFQN